MSENNSTTNGVLIAVSVSVFAIVCLLVSLPMYRSSAPDDARRIEAVIVVCQIVIVSSFALVGHLGGYMSGFNAGEEHGLMCAGISDDVITVRVVEDGREWYQRITGVQPYRVLRAVKEVASGRAFSEREMYSVGMTGSQFETLRDELLKLGHVEWKSDDHRQGVEWTQRGQAFLKEVDEMPVLVKR